MGVRDRGLAKSIFPHFPITVIFHNNILFYSILNMNVPLRKLTLTNPHPSKRSLTSLIITLKKTSNHNEVNNCL